MASIVKRPIGPARIRTIPKEGFSWIDRSFIRHGIADRLTGPELLLYFFLCSVSDRQGLSFYGDRRICRILKLRQPAVEAARRGLIRNDLIRFDSPLYQVLSLDESAPSVPFEHVTVKSAPLSHPDAMGSIRSLREILEHHL